MFEWDCIIKIVLLPSISSNTRYRSNPTHIDSSNSVVDSFLDSSLTMVHAPNHYSWTATSVWCYNLHHQSLFHIQIQQSNIVPIETSLTIITPLKSSYMEDVFSSNLIDVQKKSLNGYWLVNSLRLHQLYAGNNKSSNWQPKCKYYKVLKALKYDH